jgi:hypothetical protein
LKEIGRFSSLFGPEKRIFFQKICFLWIFDKFFLDLGGWGAIIKTAFSFFAPAFLFLLPSLRKKAGVYYRNTSEQMGIISFSLNAPCERLGAMER